MNPYYAAKQKTTLKKLEEINSYFQKLEETSDAPNILLLLQYLNYINEISILSKKYGGLEEEVFNLLDKLSKKTTKYVNDIKMGIK